VFSLFRLSTDGSGLKGFNRADKGSQNNLVDFSESAEQLDNSTGEEEGSSENELETVFDMTAQGDSLKRRRKKKVNRDSTPSPRLLQSTSSVTSSAKPLLETSAMDSSVETKPNNLSTNPFFRHSPMVDTISLTSSTSESNPFDRVQFQTVTQPSMASTPLAPKTAKASHIPTLPPPPKSSKPRTLSSSLRRPRPQNEPSPYSATIAPNKVSVEDHRRTSSVTSSIPESAKMDSSSDTPLKSDSVSLLDVQEENSSVECTPSSVAESTSLSRHHDDVPESKVSIEESAGTSKKESKIFETALQILDASSKSPPVNLNNPNIHAHPVMAEFPALSQSSLSPLEELLKSPMQKVEDLKELKLLKRDNLISSKAEWEMLMRFPREKRAMSSRKWVPVYVKLNMKQVC